MEEDQRQGSGGVEAPVEYGLAGRAVWLVVFLVVLTLWAGHHFGWKGGLPPALATFATVVMASAKVVDKLVGPDLLKGALGAFRQRMKGALTRGVLGGATAILLLAILGVSTVVVEANGSGDSGTVRLFPASSPREELPDPPAFGPEQQLVRFTIPFPWGRRFAIEADGYVGEAVRVWPMLSRRLRLADLTYSPSVLFRPGVDGLSLLEVGAVFSLWEAADGADARTLVASETAGRQASFRFGAARAVPDSVVAEWRTDLRRLGAPEEVIDEIVLVWRRPVPLTLLRDIARDARLMAEISLGEILVSRAEVRLEAKPLLDVPMTDVLYDR